MADSERTLELIQLALDGETTEAERAELDQTLANSAEARETYRALRDVVERLEAVPFAPTPPMRAAILEAIRRSTRHVNVTPFNARRRTVLAVAYAVAAAIVLGVALNRLIEIRERPVQPAHAAATMARLDDIDTWPVVSRVSSRGATEAVTLTVRRQGDRYALQPAVAGHAAVTVAWDREKLTLFEVLPPRDVQADANEITFADRSKQMAVILQRRQGASGSAVVRILIAGKESLRTTINF
jgi:hypothetical protein